MGRGGQPNVDVRIGKKNDFQLFIFTIIWKYFQSNINVMFQYSVLNKIRLGCNMYPSSLYTCARTHTHTQTHIHTFHIYYQLTTVACLISKTSNLSLIINKWPSFNVLILLKLLDQLFNLNWYLFYNTLLSVIHDLELG